MKNKKFFFGTIFIVIFSIFTFLVITEYILKNKIGLGDPVIYNAHPLWGYSPRPNRKYIRFNNEKVSINNVGLRSEQDWDDKKNNIIFIGDSVTYGGSYVSDNETFSAITCESLKNWFCYNAGINAHGILNMVARSRYDKRIQKSKIVIFVFITKDFDRGLVNSKTAHFILRSPPKYFSATWEVLNFASSRIKPNEWFGKKKEKIDKLQRERQKIINRKFALDVFISEIERLKINKKKFFIVFSPSVEELNNSLLIEKNFIINHFKQNYPDHFISLREVLSETIKKNEEKLLYRDDVHYQKKAHKIVGDYLGIILNKKVMNGGHGKN